jgi:hypothetical protein
VSVVSGSDDRLVGLDKVWSLVSAYLDYSGSWTLETASTNILPHLLHRLARRASSLAYVDAMCDNCNAFAAANGLVSQMAILDVLFPDLIISEAVTAAASGGDAYVLEWLYSRHGRVSGRPDIVKLAVPSGSLAAVRFLFNRFPLTNPGELFEVLQVSAARGYEGITRLLWGHFAGMEPGQARLNAIASCAPLSLARWIVRKARGAVSVISLDVVVQCGDLAHVQWAHNVGAVATTAAMDWTATYGYFDILAWLHLNRHEGCTSAAMDGAAGHGHFWIVRWLHSNRLEGCTDQAFFLAAIGGHLAIAKWLDLHMTQGFPVNTSDHVCAKGHLPMAQWLNASHIGGGSVDATDWAAAQNHLHVVQWLHRVRDDGCTVSAMNDSACHGHFDVVCWLHENRAEGCTTDAIDHAAGNGHFRVVRWLSEHRVEWCTTAAMDNAARGGHLDMLRWFHDHSNSLGCTQNAMDNAIGEGRTLGAGWLHRYRTEGGTSRGVDTAALKRNWGMLEFVRLHRPELLSEEAFRLSVIRGELNIASCFFAHYEAVVNMDVVIERSSSNG